MILSTRAGSVRQNVHSGVPWTAMLAGLPRRAYRRDCALGPKSVADHAVSTRVVRRCGPEHRRAGGEFGLGAGVLVFERSWQDGSGDSRDVAVIGTATASQHCDVRAC